MSDPQIGARALGTTGLVQRGGIVQEEWLPELTGVRGRRVLRQMTDSDPLIAGILLAIELLIRQVDWTVVPASDDPNDMAASDFVCECWCALQPSWTATLPEMLSFLPWGWALLELVYAPRPDGRTGWESWSIRAQDTLFRWVFDANGRVQAMVQIDPATYTERTVPLEKAIHLTTTSRKGNPEGRTLLRGAYRPWYFKTRIENIEGVGIERDLAGLPVAWVPPELLDPDASDSDKAVLAALKKIVVNIRRDEQEGIIWPLSYDAKGNKEYDLTLLTTGGRRQFDTGGIIARYDARIAMSMLSDFILLGHEKVGSFALSSDKTELFGVALGAWLDTIASAVTTQAFARLVALNGLPGAPPTLVHGDIETADLAVLGTFLEKLTNAGAVLFPNDALLAHLLKQAGLPVPTVDAATAPGQQGDTKPASDPTQQEGV